MYGTKTNIKNNKPSLKSLSSLLTGEGRERKTGKGNEKLSSSAFKNESLNNINNDVDDNDDGFVVVENTRVGDRMRGGRGEAGGAIK